MDISKVIEIIPKLFVCFIPGYIVLSIKEYYGADKKKDEKHIVTLSITISFMITTVCDIVFLKSGCNINFTTKSIIYLIVAVVFGILLVMYNNDRFKYRGKSIKERIDKMIDPNYSAKATVWLKAMKKEESPWAIIYFYDNNIAYMGKLIAFTTEPESKEKEVLLCNYRKLDIANREEIFTSENDENQVLINCKDVKSIEFLKGVECDDSNQNEDNTN